MYLLLMDFVTCLPASAIAYLLSALVCKVAINRRGSLSGLLHALFILATALLTTATANLLAYATRNPSFFPSSSDLHISVSLFIPLIYAISLSIYGRLALINKRVPEVGKKTLSIAGGAAALIVVSAMYAAYASPRTYDDCIRKHLKGISSDRAAAIIYNSCRNQFPERPAR